jgi:phospholipid/cholesterol/gamma-HCH transport system substrate-binding protein
MNELKVGLLALATMATVVFMSIKVTSNQSGFGEYITYRTIIKDASGIFPKTPIRVAGINAGRIKEIALADNNAIITFEVLEKVTVTKDSKLKIKTVGFLGDKYLEIVVGESTDRLAENGFIPAQEGGGIEDLVKDASTVLKDVKVIVGSIKESLAPPGEEPPMKKILADVAELVDNAKVATQSLKRIMNGNEERINDIIANLDEFSADIAYQVNNKNSDSAMADVKEILGNAKKVSADLEKVMADLKAGKGTMGKLLVEEQIADEVRETLSGVRQLVTTVNNLRTEMEVYTGANTLYGAESNFGLRLYPSPERFYDLGVVTSEFGVEDESIISTNVNGVESREVRSVQQKNTFLFNLQMGRHIHNWVIRGGLIQSTGGIGVDYELNDWGSKFSLDVYDYREDIGPNVRISAEHQLYNVLYGRVRLEDTLEEGIGSATFSLGLKFTDEDIRGLLALFLGGGR